MPMRRIEDGENLLPRERMLNAVRAEEVPSEALLAILLKTGAPGCDVCELSRRLLDCFGSVAALVKCDWRAFADRRAQPSVRLAQAKPTGSRADGWAAGMCAAHADSARRSPDPRR